MKTKFDLDDLPAMKALDSGGMLEILDGFPGQCREAYARAEAIEPALLTPPQGRYSAVLALGMGGSSIGSELLEALTRSSLPIPFVINRDYDIPAFTGPDTLLLVVSYSGNTEETIHAARRALATGARGLAISAGGELRELAAAHRMAHLEIPAGMPPRTALGHTFFPQLVALEKTGLIESQTRAIDEAIEILNYCRESWSPQVSSQNNLAKQLAQRLLGKIPIIYGCGGTKGVAARRWKCQMNENAKLFSAWNLFPELNHNENVGWSGRGSAYRDLAAVFLGAENDPAVIRKRLELTSRQVALRVPTSTVSAWGNGELAQALSLIYLGDHVSIYLAFLQNTDPTPIEAIVEMKKALATDREPKELPT